MKPLLQLALCSLLALAGCTNTAQRGPLCARLPILPAAAQARTLVLAFRRDAASQPIVLRLTWDAPGAPFYTPYGPLRSATLIEGDATTAIPPVSISHIEDFWPDLITLRSARTGDYELTIPQGVPIAVPGIITIRAERFVSIRTAEPSRR